MWKRALIGLSVVVNVIVAAGVLWAGSGGIFRLAERYIIQPGYERWVSQFEEVPVQPGDTVFLGDSLTEFGAWSELFPDQDVRNRGIAGDTTAGVLQRLDQVIEGRPGQVFLMIGTNDLFAGVPEAEIVANVVQIVGAIQVGSPATDIYVLSVLPRGARFQAQVESLNTSMERAIRDRATWVNLYPLFLDEAGSSIDDRYSNDELHLTGAGYLVWRDAIQDLMAAEGS